MTDSEWSVSRPDSYGMTVHADTWQVNENGDLLFGYWEDRTRQGVMSIVFYPIRAFAAGTWSEVSLYA